jgi:hypothetical protein
MSPSTFVELHYSENINSFAVSVGYVAYIPHHYTEHVHIINGCKLAIITKALQCYTITKEDDIRKQGTKWPSRKRPTNSKTANKWILLKVSSHLNRFRPSLEE